MLQSVTECYRAHQSSGRALLSCPYIYKYAHIYISGHAHCGMLTSGGAAEAGASETDILRSRTRVSLQLQQELSMGVAAVRPRRHLAQPALGLLALRRLVLRGGRPLRHHGDRHCFRHKKRPPFVARNTSSLSCITKSCRAFLRHSRAKFCTDSGEKVWEGCGKTGKVLLCFAVSPGSFCSLRRAAGTAGRRKPAPSRNTNVSTLAHAKHPG